MILFRKTTQEKYQSREERRANYASNSWKQWRRFSIVLQKHSTKLLTKYQECRKRVGGEGEIPDAEIENVTFFRVKEFGFLFIFRNMPIKY